MVGLSDKILCRLERLTDKEQVVLEESLYSMLLKNQKETQTKTPVE